MVISSEFSVLKFSKRELSENFRYRFESMPRYVENKTIFEYNWNQVVSTFWHRYPNPNSSHVLSEDTLGREVVDGCLHSMRLLRKTSGQIPQWAEKFLPKNRVAFILEESIVDPKNRVFVTFTQNIAMTKFMSVREKVVYEESTEYPGCTEAYRVACIDSKMFGLSRAICSFGVDRFKKNCHRMVQGFNYVLRKSFPNERLHLKIIEHGPDPVRNKNISEIYQNIFKNIKMRKKISDPMP